MNIWFVILLCLVPVTFLVLLGVWIYRDGRKRRFIKQLRSGNYLILFEPDGVHFEKNYYIYSVSNGVLSVQPIFSEYIEKIYIEKIEIADLFKRYKCDEIKVGNGTVDVSFIRKKK